MFDRGSARFVVHAAVAVGLHAGCGGKASTNPSQDSPIDAFAGGAAAAVCEGVGPCCKAAGLPFDADRCRKAAVRAFHTQYSPQRTVYHTQAFADCIQALRVATQSCRATDACYAAFSAAPSARARVGEPCFGTCADGPEVSCIGFGMADAGAPTTCYAVDGVYCARETSTCTRQQAQGAACINSFECAGQSCVTGVCTSSLAEGDDCATGTNYCGYGMYCADVSSSLACESGLSGPHGSCRCAKLKPNKAPCSSFGECASGCEDNQCGLGPPLGLDDLHTYCSG
jgi:hypothetical protein